MSEKQPMTSREEIASSLTEQARQLWGLERATCLQPIIDETARRIGQISQDLPAFDEEPGFYF